MIGQFLFRILMTITVGLPLFGAIKVAQAIPYLAEAGRPLWMLACIGAGCLLFGGFCAWLIYTFWKN